jgi:hypothetical protein
MADVDVAQLVREDDAKAAYGRAQDFFYAKPLAFGSLAAPAPAPDSFASNQGTVQFQLIGQKPNDAAYTGIMNENANNLLGIGGLVFDYMHKTYPSVNTQTLDINTWNNVVSNIPDLAVGKAVTKTYKNTIAGVQISGQFLSLIAKAIITDGASLLTDFTSYLNAIGDVVFSVHTTDQKYKMLACTYTNYLVSNGVGGYYDYGMITLRQIDFVEYFMELKSACASANYVNVNMSYTEIENVVQTGRIRTGGPDAAAFKELLSVNSTAQFTKAKNFFNKGAVPQNEIKPVT